ncbi:hypothetical protein V8C26DRAFT_407348 [Trichoderma gracile]
MGVRLPRLSVQARIPSVTGPQPRPAHWELPLLVSFAFWGCFGVSTVLYFCRSLDWTLLAPLCNPVCYSRVFSFCGQWWPKSQKPLIPSS